MKSLQLISMVLVMPLNAAIQHWRLNSKQHTPLVTALLRRRVRFRAGRGRVALHATAAAVSFRAADSAAAVPAGGGIKSPGHAPQRRWASLSKPSIMYAAVGAAGDRDSVHDSAAPPAAVAAGCGPGRLSGTTCGDTGSDREPKRQHHQ